MACCNIMIGGYLGTGLRAREGEQERYQRITREGTRALQVSHGARRVAVDEAPDRARECGVAGSIGRPQQLQLQPAATALIGAVETGATIGATVHNPKSDSRRSTQVSR
jgi:hypothetical protein